MEFLPSAFSAMQSYSQFIIYLLTEGKKLPADYRTGHVAGAHDPKHWTDFTTASEAAHHYGEGYGVGFVFTAADPFWFIDVDKCYNDGHWSPIALEMRALLAGCAIEISSSCRGLHFFGCGTVPEHACKNVELGIELYTERRFVALTGIYAEGDAGFDATEALNAIVPRYFPHITKPEKILGGKVWEGDWTTEGVIKDGDIAGASCDDRGLVEWACNSDKAIKAISGSVMFRDLFENNESVLAKAYPPQNTSDPYDRSSADMALATRLAWWTGNNCERMRNIMLSSRLVRDKWDRPDYLPQTILNACGRQTTWLFDKPRQNSESPPEGQQKSVPRARESILGYEEQARLFSGCTYVKEDHAIYVPGESMLLNPERFNVRFGGHTYLLTQDDGKLTRKAWEAFTETQLLIHPHVDQTAFHPELPPGEIIIREKILSINIYVPLDIPRISAPVEPFLRLLKAQHPDERDRVILLSYAAANVQYPGLKIMWCPIVQGIEGNGKSLIAKNIAQAIGMRYTHFPRAQELTSKFNDFLYAKRFIVVEDLSTRGVMEIQDRMKNIITQTEQEIEAKGAKKVIKNICANLYINTNYKDGLKITDDMRRYAVFYTAQQRLADLAEHGLDGRFFQDYTAWLDNGGQSAINEYLHTFLIPDEFNPIMGCNRAPVTSSRQEALTESLGRIEQMIMDAIEEERVGFRGGWISSIQLDYLLKDNHVYDVSPKQRCKYLEEIGYVRHPHLAEGRVTNVVAPENKKPRLFVRPDSSGARLTSPFEIGRAYSKAQEGH